MNGEEKQRSEVAATHLVGGRNHCLPFDLFELQPGDLIFTGTPEGVGAVVRGDLMKGGVDGLGEFSVHVV